MKIKTLDLQDMVLRASKGASQMRVLPITEMIGIELKDGVLTFSTTDTANTLKVFAKNVEGENFEVVVNCNLFSGLIAKLTSAFTELVVDDKKVQVRGDGVYDVPIVTDDEGPVKFPSYDFVKEGEAKEMSLLALKEVVATNKTAISYSPQLPCLRGYLLADKAYTTDNQVVCVNDTKLVDGEYLISPEMLDLLILAKEEKIKWWYDKGYFLFECGDLVLYGVEQDGKSEYPLDKIGEDGESIPGVQTVMAQEWPSRCKIQKVALQSLLDRLSLFIEDTDEGGAYFTFTPEGIKVTSKKSSSDELIKYNENQGFAPFKCCVDIPMLKKQVDANPGEIIDLYYGIEEGIKLVSGKVSQYVSLLNDTELNKEE